MRIEKVSGTTGRFIASNTIAKNVRLCAALFFAVCLNTGARAEVVGCNTVPAVPTVPKGARTFISERALDDAAAIQKALNELKPGDSLAFAPGTYTISKHLIVRVPRVTLYGAGATIHATSETDGALLIQGDDVAVYGFKWEQDSTARQTTPWAGGISVFDDRGGGRRQVRGTIIQGNTINRPSAAGIFLYKADHFTVANNTVWRSRGDGIHVTGGATNGLVIHNRVSQTGDDSIAVVSYVGSPDSDRAAAMYKNWAALKNELDRNIYIGSNQVSDQYWGRGISVVGGSDVTIENNTISKVPACAGIYLTRETSYMTFGDHNILIRNNTISQIQTISPSFTPLNINLIPSQQGAIEVGSTLLEGESNDPVYRDAFSISDVAILDNKVESTRYSGIRLGVSSQGDATLSAPNGSTFKRTTAPGAVRQILVQGNTFDNVGTDVIVLADVGLDRAAISCKNNTLNGALWGSQCNRVTVTSMQAPAITGASLQCGADGALKQPIPPKPPWPFAVH